MVGRASSARESVRRHLALLDFGSLPTTRAGWALRIAMTLIVFYVAYGRWKALVQPMLRAKAPATIPNQEVDDYRFRLPLRTRQEIFAEMAAGEIAERKRAVDQNTWKGHLWSREDDRGYVEKTLLRQLAARHNVSLSQLYLVLDEGIRERWLGPDGQSLRGTTPPLDPRSTW